LNPIILTTTIIGFVLALIAGFTLAWLAQKKKIGEYEKIGKKILEDAKKEAEVMTKEASIQAKHIVLQARNELEQEIKNRRFEMQNSERRLSQKESNLDKKMDGLERKEEELAKKEREVSARQSQYDLKIKEGRLISQSTARMVKISDMTAEERRKCSCSNGRRMQV
jgi:ribonuclease Y